MIQIKAHRVEPEAVCPSCQHASRRVHSYYTRTLKDLPLEGKAVCLQLRVRRFRCTNGKCASATFAEPLSELAVKHAQRTERFTCATRAIGLALGGQAGQRLAARLALLLSADTILRIIRATLLPGVSSPLRVIGVDDWALKRSHVYGTLVVDLEQHRPVDLLTDRTAETLAKWLKAHPEIAVVSRDRSTEYMRGITAGAPLAEQVIDRWHLLKNVREVLERIVASLYSSLRQLRSTNVNPSAPVLQRPARQSPQIAAERQAKRQARLDRFEQVRALRQQGMPILRIAKTLQMSRVTVRTYLKAETFPEIAPRSRTSQLDPYRAHLHQRWQQGCRNGSQLWREIVEQGYPGGRRQVAKWMSVRREEPRRYANRPEPQQSADPTTQAIPTQHPVMPDKLPAPKKLAWLLLKPKPTLDASESALLQYIRQHPVVALSYRLAQRLAAMIRSRSERSLDAWLTACDQSQIPDWLTFAAGLRSDLAAVRLALRLPWSNGQLEGQVNRLKLIKRQMYGRAKFDLLRIRVLTPS
jgi:transposase